MAKEAKTLTFAEISAFKTGEIASGLGQAVTLEKRAVKNREQLKSELPAFGKYHAALEIRYTELLNAGEIVKTVSKTDWIETSAGGKIPNGVLQMSNVVASLILTNGVNGKPMLAEENYDNAKAEWLRDTSAIINHCKAIAAEMAKDGKTVDWRGMDDVLDALNCLSKAGDAGKKLKEIRKRQKGESAQDDAKTEAQPLTIGRAVEFLKAAFGNAPQVDADQQKALCIAVYELNDAWATCGLPEETLNRLDAEISAARAAGIAPTIVITHGEKVAA